MKKMIMLVMCLCVVLVGLNANAATITAGDTAMLVGVDDIGQLQSPNSDSLNIDGTAVYTGDNDGSTYVANDRTTQGQTFITGADPDGYTLNGIYVKHVLYTDEMNNGTWSGLSDGTAITVRVCSVSGTSLIQLSSETATVGTGSGIPGGAGGAPYWGGTGKWLYIALDTPVTLNADAEYAFDLSSNGPWFELAGLEAGPYSGGVAYSTAAKGDLDMGTVHTSGDRTFALDMATNNKLVYDAPADDFWVENPLLVSGQVLSWTVNDAALTHIDLYFGPENEPNLITDAQYQKYSMEAVSTVSYAVGDLENDTTYYWRIDAYEPNTLPGGSGYFKHTGPVWRFTTVPADAVISVVDPAFTAVDAGAEAELFVTGISVDSYQWYKIGDPDVQLEDGADYDGVTTDTLTIKDVQLADEGDYYCVGTNSLGSTSNRDSGPGCVMTKRLTSHYMFETVTIVDGNDVTPDGVDGFDATLLSEGNTAVPVLDDTVQLDPSLGKYLLLDNADHDTDPNGQYAQIPAGVAEFEDLTISMWVYWNGGGEWQRILDFGSDQANYMMLTPDAGGDGGLRFASRVNNGDQQQVNDDPLVVGEWTHLAITISGDTGRLYRDGELVDTNSNLTINPLDISQSLNYIGKSQYPDPEFDGMIDDLKIYNYARTNEELALEYLGIVGGSVCNYELNDLNYDFNDDCQVNLEDFAMFVTEWLDDYFIYAP